MVYTSDHSPPFTSLHSFLSGAYCRGHKWQDCFTLPAPYPLLFSLLETPFFNVLHWVSTGEWFYMENILGMRIRWLQTDFAAFTKTSGVEEDPKVEEYQICSTITFLHQPHHRSRRKLIANSSSYFPCLEVGRGGVVKKKSENLYYYINTKEAGARSTSEKVLFLEVYHQMYLQRIISDTSVLVLCLCRQPTSQKESCSTSDFCFLFISLICQRNLFKVNESVKGSSYIFKCFSKQKSTFWKWA